MTPFRMPAGAALAAGILLLSGDSAAQYRPQQKFAPIQPPPQSGRPVIVGAEVLPVVPKSVPMFLSVKVSALADHPDLKPVFEQLRKTPEGTEGFAELLGVAPHEIDRVTLFWPIPPALPWLGRPVWVVTTREAYNEARLLKSLGAKPVFKGDWQRDIPGAGMMRDVPAAKSAPPISKEADFPKPPPPDIPKSEAVPKFDPKPPAEDEDSFLVPISANLQDEALFFQLQRGPFELVFLVDDRTVVFLPRDLGHGNTQLVLLSQLLRKESSGPLAEAIAAAGGHTFSAGAHLKPLFRWFDQFLPAEMAPYAALLAARRAVITGDLDKSARLTQTLTFDDAAAARRAGPVLEEGLKTLAAKLAAHAAEIKEHRPGPDRAVAPFRETFVGGLKNATSKAVGNTVVATADFEVGPAAGKSAAELIQSLASMKRLTEHINNLKQIGLALHNYNDANGKLPTNICNAKGEAILSWRVQLLPYLEYENIYRQMKLDEPWDGPTNKRFIEQMPKVFEVPGREAQKGRTYYQGFVSPDPRKAPPGGNRLPGRAWLMEGDRFGRSIPTILDGSSNTIAVAEAREAVIWSKPDDLPFGEKVPALGEERADRFGVLMFDGSVRMLPAKIDPGTLRALITLDGGEVVPDDLEGPRRSVPGGIAPVKKPDRLPTPPPIIKEAPR